MIGLILAAALLSQQPAGLSAEARALVVSVAEAIAAEKARQAALPPPTTDRERLERMGALDQVGRRAFTVLDFSALPADERQTAETLAWADINAVDKALLDELLTMVPAEGWFKKSVYGERAAGAAFLIIQHSDLEKWRRFVPVLEALVAQGEVEGQSYGLMYDRLAINEGRPQRYGTQMTCKNGRWVVDTLEDPERVEQWRREMKFPWTLAGYEARFRDYPPCTQQSQP
ncbi:hypothetical protein PFY01_08300 [Brevundimonas vesicularis]|uniref:DUF6624 domain-containing protein n=1 Tax=Brevundimonas vesicularis TaxID=41276 RepID=UPI0022EC2DBA|nr:DUF6624 domain-containing protein [Brevundimonas vesicularis]WBT04742.1 hypothetical protein PFY01_08300 [Brevundimonas vesicularis]